MKKICWVDEDQSFLQKLDIELLKKLLFNSSIKQHKIVSYHKQKKNCSQYLTISVFCFILCKGRSFNEPFDFPITAKRSYQYLSMNVLCFSLQEPQPPFHQVFLFSHRKQNMQLIPYNEYFCFTPATTTLSSSLTVSQLARKHVVSTLQQMFNDLPDNHLFQRFSPEVIISIRFIT